MAYTEERIRLIEEVVLDLRSEVKILTYLIKRNLSKEELHSAVQHLNKTGWHGLAETLQEMIEEGI